MSFNIYFVVGCIIIGIFWVIVTLIRTTVNSRAKKKELETQGKMVKDIMTKLVKFYNKMLKDLKLKDLM